VQGTQLYDPRIPVAEGGFGPLDSVAGFHKAIQNGLEDDPDMVAHLKWLISMQNSFTETCFAHGDLSSRNIIVRNDNITGIIDSETAGWYPEYWEYTQNTCNMNYFDSFWVKEADKFLEKYPDVVNMEELRLKYFGDF
jgi:aminoglycoside phosphotransferase